MEAYLQTMTDVLTNGVWQKNERTGEMCCMLDGALTSFDLRQGFPAVTTKKLAWKSITAEFVGFLRGVRSAAYFRELGSKVWDQNANENAAWVNNPFRQGPDDLGDIYGVQWRRWPAYKHFDETQPNFTAMCKAAEAAGYRSIGHLSGYQDPEDRLYYKEIDQLGDCIRTLIMNPADRRILFHGWNPAKLDEVALPACHILYQFIPNLVTRELSMMMYIRSWDTFLGGPFNIAEGGLMLELAARLTDFKPKNLKIFSGDTQVYEKHVEAVTEQLQRTPYPAPKLNMERIPTFEQLFYNNSGINANDTAEHYEEVKRAAAEEAVTWLDKVEPTDFELIGYQHHAPISAPMAV